MAKESGAGVGGGPTGGFPPGVTEGAAYSPRMA
jgi:hypothetical protein